MPCLLQMTANGAGSPVNGAIGAVQAGQGPGSDLVRELAGLVEAGMDVACFDLSQGLLEQHLDIADTLTEVCAPGLNLSACCAVCACTFWGVHLSNCLMCSSTTAMIDWLID